MRWLTEDADLRCQHVKGRVDVVATQTLVRINGRRVLLTPDTVSRPIGGCPFLGPGQKPCSTTRSLRTGTSRFVRIVGRAVCLDAVRGLTDGSPGAFEYLVRDPGQELVDES